jgi:hypothetical protein
MNELRLLRGTRPDHEIETELLEDDNGPAGAEAAVDVLFVMADADARWGDYASAVRVLDAVAATSDSLPAEYAIKHVRWANIAGVRRARSLTA